MMAKSEIKLNMVRSDAYGLNPKTGVLTKRAIPLLKDFAVEYLERSKLHKKSWKDDQSKLENWLLPALGTKRLDMITRQDIDGYRGSFLKTHAAGTANRHLSLLSAMLSLAVEWDLIEKNPALGLKRYKESMHCNGAMQPNEIKDFIRALRSESNISAANVLLFLLLTGLRLNEVTRLRWEFVDIEQKQIFLSITKSGKSRYVPISDDALAILTGIERRESVYVFPGKDLHKPVHNVRKAFLRALNTAGIVRHIRIHDLRHTYASIAVSHGVTLFQVQELLGHSSPQMTQRYAHIQSKSLRAAANVVTASMVSSDS